MKMYVTRIHKLEGDGATKAFADLCIEDVLVINGLRVVEGKDGLFISMPREAGKDGKWYNTVIPLSREIKDEIERVVLEAYDGSTPARSLEQSKHGSIADTYSPEWNKKWRV